MAWSALRQRAAVVAIAAVLVVGGYLAARLASSERMPPPPRLRDEPPDESYPHGSIGLIEWRGEEAADDGPLDDGENDTLASDGIADEPSRDDDDDYQPGARGHLRHGQRRHHQIMLFDDFDDEEIHVELDPAAPESPDPTAPGESSASRFPADSLCGGRLPCILANTLGNGPLPDAPAAVLSVYRRALDDFRAGRFRDATEGFAAVATDMEMPPLPPPPTPPARGSVDRLFVCSQAAISWLAAGGSVPTNGDGARPRVNFGGSPQEDDADAGHLGLCASSLADLLSPAPPPDPPPPTSGPSPPSSDPPPPTSGPSPPSSDPPPPTTGPSPPAPPTDITHH